MTEKLLHYQYECFLCGKRYVRRGMMERHFLSFHRKRKYQDFPSDLSANKDLEELMDKSELPF